MSSFLRRHFPNVEEVVDARAGVLVTVKLNDCATGRSKRPTECALAKAVKRQYKADGAIIGMGTSYIIQGKKAIRFKTPDTVAREIVSFDRHKDFAPGEYSLSPISPCNRSGARSSKAKGTHPTRIVHRETARVRVLDKGTSW